MRLDLSLREAFETTAAGAGGQRVPAALLGNLTFHYQRDRMENWEEGVSLLPLRGRLSSDS